LLKKPNLSWQEDGRSKNNQTTHQNNHKLGGSYNQRAPE